VDDLDGFKGGEPAARQRAVSWSWDCPLCKATTVEPMGDTRPTGLTCAGCKTAFRVPAPDEEG
jgi:hypothetical protein